MNSSDATIFFENKIRYYKTGCNQVHKVSFRFHKITQSQVQRQRHLCSTELTFLLLPLWLLSRSVFSFSPSFCVLFSSFWSWSPLSSSFNLNGKAKQQYPMIELILVYLTYSCLSKATKSDEPPCNQPAVTQVTGNEVPMKEGKGNRKATGRIKQKMKMHIS